MQIPSTHAAAASMQASIVHMQLPRFASSDLIFSASDWFTEGQPIEQAIGINTQSASELHWLGLFIMVLMLVTDCWQISTAGTSAITSCTGASASYISALDLSVTRKPIEKTTIVAISRKKYLRVVLSFAISY